MKRSFTAYLLQVFASISLFLALLPCSASGFNIDTRNPIVITNNFDSKGSHFGYSVLLLQPSNTSSKLGFSTTGWVIIGAPKGNSSHANHTNIKEPGTLWRCSLGRVALETNECKLLVLDPTDEFDPRIKEVAHTDWKHEGWLGGSMSMGSERFVACASRWCNQKYKIHGVDVKDHFMNGICYWVPKDHLQADVVNQTWPWLPENYSYRLLPLIDIKRRNVWAYGEAGFSAHLGDGDMLIMGAPGISSGSGGVIEYSDNIKPAKAHKRYNSNGNKAFAQVLVAPSMPLVADDSRVFEYFGYTVTSGRYFNPTIGRNSTQYVAGAPRANSLRGKVYIFTLEGPSKNGQYKGINASDAQINLIDSLEPDYNFSDTFSYFGSALCTCDINNDGFDDLLVGAPYFSLHEYQSHGPGEQGCVFVYTSDGIRFNKTAAKICGSTYRFSNFGSAISALGDIDGDGYADVAIGAPREKRGAVYIYRGSPRGLKLSQKLTPEFIQPAVLGFGMGLSPGADIDGNLYPDLAVGCYMSEQVVVYRTIPVVTTTAQIKADIDKLWSNVYNFNLTSCISFQGKSLPQVLDFVVNITLDINCTMKRGNVIEWDLRNLNRTNGIRILHVTPKSLSYKSSFQNGTCYAIPAIKVQDTTFPEPLTLRQVHELQRHDKDDQRVSAINYEISRRGDGTASMNFNGSESDFTSFYNKTPLAHAQTSSETIEQLYLSMYCYDTTEHICAANLSLHVNIHDTSSSEMQDSNATKSWTVQYTNKLLLQVTVENIGEYAHLPISVKIFLKISPDISIRNDDQNCIKKDDPTNHLECGIGHPMRQGNMTTLNVTVVLEKIFYGKTSSLSFEVRAQSKNSHEVVYPYELPLFFQSYIKFFNLKSPRIFLPRIASGLFTMYQNFTMELIGPSPVFAIQLEFYIPQSIRITRTDETVIIGIPEIYDPRGKVRINCVPRKDNWLITDFTADHNSTRIDANVDGVGFRENEFEIKNLLPWRAQKKTGAQNLSIDCGSPNVNCTAIICDPIKYFEPGDTTNFELKLKLDPKQIKFFQGLQKLEIQSQVKGKFTNDKSEILGDDEFVGILVTNLTFQTEAEFPAWAVIVGTSSGVVLLILVILGLSQ
ncbi:unnamed protein product, partial [Allacma fusca]